MIELLHNIASITRALFGIYAFYRAFRAWDREEGEVAFVAWLALGIAL